MGTFWLEMVSLWWGTFSTVLVPVGIIIFIFLSLPLGRFRLLGVKFINYWGAYGLNLASWVFLGCMLLVYWECLTWNQHANNWHNFTDNGHPGDSATRHELLGKKWRADRNLWIASMCAFVWMAVWSLAMNVKNQEAMKEHVE